MNIQKLHLFFIFCFLLIACGESDPIIPKEPDAVSEIITELNLATGANNQTISFATNKKWETMLTSPQGDISWCTISPTSGNAGSVNISVMSTENTGYDDRSVMLTIKTGNTIKNINITQKQKNAIIISKSSFEIPEEGGIFEVEVNTNVALSVSIPSDIEWIRVQNSQTRTLSTETIVFTVDKNTLTESRNAEITVKDTNSELTQNIRVHQNARTIISRTVEVETSGTIKELLGDNFLQIEELTVIGEINGTDVDIIREMAGSDRVLKPTNGVLYKLDLTNAQIVEGGNAYCYPDFSTYDACYTSNDVLGNFMFYKCNKLKEIILPKTILEIKDYAISWCDNLENIVINESVEYIGQSGLSTNRKLINVNLPDNIKIIERWALSNNHSLESIVLPRNLKSIGESLFAFCKKLKSIEFPPNVTTINDFAFQECEGLETINITDSINIVGPYAFYKCINIKRVTFGSNVSSIGHDAFNYCDQITEIYCKNPIPPTLGTTLYTSPTFTQTVFKNCNVYIPKGSYESYYTSLMWRYFDKLIETDF